MNLIFDKDGVWVSQATKGGYVFCEYGGVFDVAYPSSNTRRGRVQSNGRIAPTVTATVSLRVEKR